MNLRRANRSLNDLNAVASTRSETLAPVSADVTHVPTAWVFSTLAHPWSVLRLALFQPLTPMLFEDAPHDHATLGEILHQRAIPSYETVMSRCARRTWTSRTLMVTQEESHTGCLMMVGRRPPV